MSALQRVQDRAAVVRVLDEFWPRTPPDPARANTMSDAADRLLDDVVHTDGNCPNDGRRW